MIPTPSPICVGFERPGAAGVKGVVWVDVEVGKEENEEDGKDEGDGKDEEDNVDENECELGMVV